MNSRRSSIAGNPILIGAVTILISIVAIFLAYTANQGLPFVPSYDLTAQLPNADALVKGNEVKIGGSRVGQVTAIEPKTWPDGRVTAIVKMKLDKQVEPIPNDSTVEIRPVSPLGLKYVDIHRGRSPVGFSSGTTMPIAAATPKPVQIDEIFNMFDKPTREASSANLIEFGNSLAGRGLALNQTIRNLQPLLQNLEPVMAGLNKPSTALAAFFPALERAANQAAPVAEQQASLFRNLAVTFTALSQVTDAIQATLAGGPAALDAATNSFPAQSKLLADSSTLFATLTPGSQALGAAAPTLNHAVTVGVGSVARSASTLNPNLTKLLQGLGVFFTDPVTTLGVNRLIGTTKILDSDPGSGSINSPNSLLGYLTPVQATCNYVSILLRNAASSLSDDWADSGAKTGGTFQRAMPIVTGNGPNPGGPWIYNSEGGTSNAVSNGPDGGGSYGTNYLHINPNPWTGQSGISGQPLACGAGNEAWPAFPDAPPTAPATVQAQGFDPTVSPATRHDSTTPPERPPGKP